MEINGKVITITGAAQGLGRAMALDLAQRGARLSLIDLDAERLATTATACREHATTVHTYVGNVADEDEVVRIFDNIIADCGRLDALINNAGIIRDALLIKSRNGQVSGRMSLEQWQAVIDVNLTGVFLCGREAAERMIVAKRPGVIINISSVSCVGNMGQSNYSAAKAGVAAMTVTWAKELARHQIRVAAISPGFAATELVASMKPQALEKLSSMIPLNRLAQPEEIAHTVVFVLENDYLSGRSIEVDGALRL